MSVQLATEVPGGTRQLITIDAHTLLSDATAASGGGTAPDPHDLFDASLASCKAITAILYARVKGMKLERVLATVTRDASKEREGLYVLDVQMQFEGELTEAERKRLHDVAGRCPVHKLMTTTTVEIRQTLVGESTP